MLAVLASPYFEYEEYIVPEIFISACGMKDVVPGSP
jgi:hypothetical protein